MDQKKLTNRQLKALETKELLYKAASKLFNEKGYENVLVEDITNAANTAKGTFYNYFESKKDVLYHTFSKFDEIYNNAYDKVRELPTFEERLLTFIKHSYKQIDEMGKKIPWALYYNSMLDDVPWIIWDERALYKIIKEIVEFGIKTGELNSNKPAQYYLEMIKTQIVGIDYRWCVSTEQMNFSEFATDNMSVFIKGLANI